jgi:hypothetical protein
MVAQLPKGDHTNTRPYHERGWCFFEHRMASLIKNSEWVLPLAPMSLALQLGYLHRCICAHVLIRTLAFVTGNQCSQSRLLWDMANWTEQTSYEHLRITMARGREPPSSPSRVEDEMRRRIAEGSLSFSYAADVEPVIAMCEYTAARVNHVLNFSVADVIFVRVCPHACICNQRTGI